MDKNIFSQNFTNILISKKIFGIWVEFWSEKIVIGDNHTEFFQSIRDKYRKKFKGKPFRMRLYYPDDYFEVTETNVKHI